MISTQYHIVPYRFRVLHNAALSFLDHGQNLAPMPPMKAPKLDADGLQLRAPITAQCLLAVVESEAGYCHTQCRGCNAKPSKHVWLGRTCRAARHLCSIGVALGEEQELVTLLRTKMFASCVLVCLFVSGSERACSSGNWPHLLSSMASGGCQTPMCILKIEFGAVWYHVFIW